MFVRPRLPASARAVSTIPATGSVYITDPVGPTMHEIVSDGSPLPPPISSTFWLIPIRASSTRPAVNGANICAISTRYLSQYRAEICHASSAFLCSSGIILVRREANPFLPRRGRTNKFLEARIIPKRIEHRIEPKQRRSERHVKAAAWFRKYFLQSGGGSFRLSRAR